ncbi:VanZ family protein [Longirhabdus pacifica]|uniref:VanZ family protein n=1 Tax=Longirhabdus pacifica TaxID=2305227 RepID=UPI0013E8CEFF|nr:VanZ family protein [Longirhabdus pacifica]
MRWAPAFIVMSMIYYLSDQPDQSLNTWLTAFQQWVPWMDSFNWGHLVAYFTLAVTYYWALANTFHPVISKLITVGLCVLYGLSDEYHQTFVEGRMADWYDIRNDTIGAMIAVIILSLPPVKQWFSYCNNKCKTIFS